MVVPRSPNRTPVAVSSLGESQDSLLDEAGQIEGAHAVVIGERALPVLCALIRRGAAAAAELQATDRSIAEPVELAILPHVASHGTALRAIALAWRSLLPCGRLVMRIVPSLHEGGVTAQSATALLGRSGFTAIRSRAVDDGFLISADRPLFGLADRAPLTLEAARALAA